MWRRARRRLFGRRRGERGTSLVEFALVLPVFSLLLFSLVDFGLAFGGFITLENHVNAAGRAVSVASVPASCDSASNEALCTVEAIVGNSFLGVQSGSVKYAITFPDYPTSPETAGEPVIVCAQATLKASTGVTSPLLNGRLVTAKSQILLEQNPTIPSSGIAKTYSSVSGFSC